MKKVENSRKYEDAIEELRRAIEQAEAALRDEPKKSGGQNLTNVFDDLKDAAKKVQDALKDARDKAIDAFKGISTEDIKKMSGKEILENIKNNADHVSDNIKDGVKKAQQALDELDSAQQAFVTNVGESIVEGYRELTEIIDIDALVKEAADSSARELSVRGGDNVSFPACIVVVLVVLAGIAWMVEKFQPAAAKKIIENMVLIAPGACVTYYPES